MRIGKVKGYLNQPFNVNNIVYECDGVFSGKYRSHDDDIDSVDIDEFDGEIYCPVTKILYKKISELPEDVSDSLFFLCNEKVKNDECTFIDEDTSDEEWYQKEFYCGYEE